MSTRERQRLLSALGFIGPNLIGFAVFTVVPVLFSFCLAFLRWDMFHAPQFVGFDNFTRLLTEPKTWFYLYNTFFFMLGAPLSIAGSLFLAVLLSQKLRGIVVYRTIFYLPTVTNGVALFLLWKWLYNPKYGLINSLLVGLAQMFDPNVTIDRFPDWLRSSVNLPLLGESFWAKPAIMFMGIWASIGGGNMILYLAALANVPQELYEAGDMDGTSRWQRFWFITVPSISPTTFFISIMAVIGGLQGGFEVAYLMTGGGPGRDGDNTITMGYYIYREAFEKLDMGYAAAIAWFLFLIVFAVTVLYWKHGRGQQAD